MENGHHKNFTFDEFNLETEQQTLRRGGAEIHLAKRPFDVLLFLIENRERVVSRDELLNKYWDGHDVYDDALRKCVGAIRKALDDTEKSPRFIETRWGNGYRFIGAVENRNAIVPTAVAEASRLRDDNGQDVESEDVSAGRALDSRRDDGVTFKQDVSAGRTHDSRRDDGVTVSPRYVFAAIFTVVLILLVTFAFFVYRRQTENIKPKTFTEAVMAKHLIAVLPLKNLTGEAANDYLTDGITESLIDELSRIPNLKVISRSSVFQFKDKTASPQEIGEQLGVETILEGGVRRNGNKIRVETRLVNAKDGSVL